MEITYKPSGYNSLSPYLITDDAERLVDLLKTIFYAAELRRFHHDNGSIAHLELKLDDTVIMISDSTDEYPANTTMLHMYVPDVMKTFELAVSTGCKTVVQPVNQGGDPDTRGAFMDFAGNCWAVSTQRSESVIA
jgi:PhnB protein